VRGEEEDGVLGQEETRKDNSTDHLDH
jgi:hypothetical protein